MSSALSLSFIVLVVFLYAVLIIGATYANFYYPTQTRWPLYFLRVFLGGFLLLTGLGGLSRIFMHFRSMPPKIVYGVVPGFAAMLFFAFHPVTKRWLKAIPLWWLLIIQSFRIIVEIQLYFLAQTPFLPKMMTFEGANIDIIVGLTAPIIAFLAWRNELKKASPNYTASKFTNWAVGIWNIAGIMILTNVVVRGILSTPGQFQLIITDPPNRVVGFFPFNWLPMFVVPTAYLFHILALRKMSEAKAAS